jgi:hypothetical protein
MIKDSTNELEQIFYNIVKKAGISDNIELWREALRKIQDAEESPSLLEIIRNMVSGSKELEKGIKGINNSNLSEKEIIEATKIAVKMPEVVNKEGSINFKKLHKISYMAQNFNSLKDKEKKTIFKTSKS